MQIRVNDLRNRVEVLRRRKDALEEKADSIKMEINASNAVKEYDIDRLCQYYVVVGRHLEAENMLHVRGVPGV